MTPLAGSIPAGGYYLIWQDQGAGGTTPLPTADATGDIPISASSGKVALVRDTAALSCAAPGCDTTFDVLDFVGYGSANDSETAPAPGLSNTTAALRAGGGEVDTDNNANDFTVGAANPRNSGRVPTLTTSATATASLGGAISDTATVTGVAAPALPRRAR